MRHVAILLTSMSFLAVGATAHSGSALNPTLAPNESKSVPLQFTHKASAMEHGIACVRVDLEPGQIYTLDMARGEDRQKYVRLSIHDDTQCAQKPRIDGYGTKSSSLVFQSEGGTFYVRAGSGMGADVSLSLTSGGSGKAKNIGKGAGAPALDRQTVLAEARETAPVPAAQVVAASTPDTATRPSLPSSGAIPYRGGIQTMAFGQEVTGHIMSGPPSSTGDLMPVLSFEGRKGQTICVRVAGPPNILAMSYLEYSKKGVPEYQAKHVTYPSDPMLYFTGSSMKVTLDKSGTYFLYPMLFTKDHLSKLKDSAGWYRSLYHFPSDFAGKGVRDSFAVKLWDARQAEPASISDLMAAQDRPTWHNGRNLGIYATGISAPLMNETRQIKSATILPSGQISNAWTNVLTNAVITEVFTPSVPLAFIGPVKTVNLECDGNWSAWYSGGYDKRVQFPTLADTGAGAGKVLASGDGRYRPQVRNAEHYPSFSFQGSAGLRAVTEKNVEMLLSWADNEDIAQRRLAAEKKIQDAEARARKERVWAGILGGIARGLSDADASNRALERTYKQSAGTYTVRDAIGDMSPEARQIMMDNLSKQRAAQVQLDADSRGSRTETRQVEAAASERASGSDDAARGTDKAKKAEEARTFNERMTRESEEAQRKRDEESAQHDRANQRERERVRNLSRPIAGSSSGGQVCEMKSKNGTVTGTSGVSQNPDKAAAINSVEFELKSVCSGASLQSRGTTSCELVGPASARFWRCGASYSCGPANVCTGAKASAQ